jgi:hypothetical protein
MFYIVEKIVKVMVRILVQWGPTLVNRFFTKTRAAYTNVYAYSMSGATTKVM